MAVNHRSRALWGNLRPLIPEAMSRAISLMRRPPDALTGLQHRHEQVSGQWDGMDNDALQDVATCLLADLVLVLAMMEANNERR